MQIVVLCAPIVHLILLAPAVNKLGPLQERSALAPLDLLMLDKIFVLQVIARVHA